MPRSEVAGRIHSIETFGTVDGPGTRLVVFMQGCSMRCAYCHNPETWEVVPPDAPEMAGDGIAPGRTAPAHPGTPPVPGRPGRRMTVGEVLNAFERNRPFYRRGGITVSGGEPLMQPQFVAALFAQAHAAPAGRIHTCLDSSGIAFDPAHPGPTAAVLDHTDLVLLDVKHSDPEGHLRLTGHHLERILAFGDELARREIPVIVRHVVVPGITDDPEELAGIGRIIARWPNVVGLDVLPYHTMGVSKYERLGIDYPLASVPAMDASRVPKLREQILSARDAALRGSVFRTPSGSADEGDHMDARIREVAELWRANVTEADLAAELAALMADPSSEGLSDAFYRSLKFGTAGLRGTLGVGTNRMNVYTVAQATQGLATYLNAHFESPTVAIARDSRNKGADFVRVTAGVLAANGITSVVYPRIEPVPTLSFATRDLACSAGICITASHNPAAYNGYKVYGPDGCQIANEAADEIQAAIDQTDVFRGVKRMDFDEALAAGLVTWTPDAVLDRFIDAVASQSVGPAPSPDFSVVYTPLNGTGLECVQRILSRVGITNVTVVPEQAEPDGNFPTCPYPNPESREALQRGLDLSDKVHPDLMLATDPDADRMGVAVPHAGGYELLTGNEMGVLLTDWLCRMKAEAGEDISRKVAVTTIVSTAMPDALAAHYGLEVRRVLTGFKNIGGQMDQLVEAGEGQRFLIGFEESYGYLVGLHARDKDAIVASMLACEMAAWYASRGQDLYEAMGALYQTYGFYLNGVVNVGFPGQAGASTMADIMSALRTEPPSELAGMAVAEVVDYETDVYMPVVGGDGSCPAQLLPKSNVVEFRLGEGVKLIVRPSGTEPKIKAYLFSNGSTRAESEALQARLATAAKQLLSRPADNSLS